MNAPPKPSFVNRLAVDSMILSAIVLTTMLLMNVRLHNRVIERTRGLVLYTPAVTKPTARRLADELKERGLFAGSPSSIRLDHTDNVYDIRIIVPPAVAEAGPVRQHTAKIFGMICAAVFQDSPARVQLSDDNFKPYSVLVEHP